MSDLEQLTAEITRLRAERNRLFGLVVAAEQIDQAGRGLTRTQAIKQVMGWMTTLDPPNPDGEIARALAEHDRPAGQATSIGEVIPKTERLRTVLNRQENCTV